MTHQFEFGIVLGSVDSSQKVRLIRVPAAERDEASSQFLESNARVSFLQWVGWNSWLRAVIELLASVTSETDELKSRDNSGPAFIAVSITQDTIF